jgi:hypothetical protein
MIPKWNLILSCLVIVPVLTGCNSTESAKSGPDPAFDMVKMDSAFFGTWSGSVFVPANGQTQPVEFILGAHAASGYNFTASCTADLRPVKAEPSRAYYDVILHSGTCVQDALMEFTLNGPTSLGIRMHYPTEPDKASDFTLMGSGTLTKK